MQLRRRLLSAAAIVALIASPFAAATPATAKAPHSAEAELLASGIKGASGSTIGPDGALYVTEGVTGKVLRIDPWSGKKRTYAKGLPKAIPGVGLGGATDVVFKGHTAYVLVTVVGKEVGGTKKSGIYRIDDYDSNTLVADLGKFSRNNLPEDTEFFLRNGVQFAIELFHGGFLVTDGHHNRILFATKRGHVEEWLGFGNIVPTGLAVSRKKVYMAEAGPVPHLPETGKVISIDKWDLDVRDVASGYSLLTDVEFARCGLFALSQGDSPGEVEAGAPALPDSGELLRVKKNGTFRVVAEGLDRPTSVDFRRNTAFVTTLAGEVLRIDHVCGHRHHHHH